MVRAPRARGRRGGQRGRGRRVGRSGATTATAYATGYDSIISLRHRIPVGYKDGPAPVIYALDWNPREKRCKGANATDMIACVSSFGTQIFKRDKASEKWVGMVITERPIRKGYALNWHITGTALVTSCVEDGEDTSNLYVLTYDSNYMRFSTKMVYECPKGQSISSLVWDSTGVSLAVAFKPSSEISIFKFENEDPATLKIMGRTKISGFPEGATILLTAHNELEYIFVSAKEANHIQVWRPHKDKNNEWAAGCSANCGRGILSVEFANCDIFSGILTVHEGSIWRLWKLNPNFGDLSFQEIWKSEREHNKIKGGPKRISSDVCYIGMDRLGQYIFSVGTGETLMFHGKDPVAPT